MTKIKSVKKIKMHEYIPQKFKLCQIKMKNDGETGETPLNYLSTKDFFSGVLEFSVILTANNPLVEL